VRGYKEEGTIAMPFDMAVLNDLDRFPQAIDAIERMQISTDTARACRKFGVGSGAVRHE
jgi:phosphoketolase